MAIDIHINGESFGGRMSRYYSKLVKGQVLISAICSHVDVAYFKALKSVGMRKRKFHTSQSAILFVMLALAAFELRMECIRWIWARGGCCAT